MDGWRFDGSPGRLLDVDLSTGSLRIERLSADLIRSTLGGKALATELLVHGDTTDLDAAYSHVHPVSGDPDPARDPTTPVVLATGPFQGSPVGSSGRAVIATRSPLTNVFIDTYIGGDWGHDLRRAGFDAIRVHGASEGWVRLDIHDQEVRLVDATPLVGASTWVTEQRIASVQGSDVNTMSIGPGGERGSRIASPIVDGRRAAGRGGTGAQFGWKGLKAISVRATGSPRWADDPRLAEAVADQRSRMGKLRRHGDPFYRFGTSRGPIYASASARMPTANYASTTARIPDHHALLASGGPGGAAVEIVHDLDPWTQSGEHWHSELPDAKQSSCCRPCPIACEAADRPMIEGARSRQRPRYTERVDRPEYETLALLGSNLGISSSLDVMDGNDACNQVGVDTISAGAALSLMCELALRGWWPEQWSEGSLDASTVDALRPAWPSVSGRLPAFLAPVAHGRFRAGDLVPWAFGIPELPPLAIARLGMAEAGGDDAFGILTTGAVATATAVEALTGHPATRLTAHCKGLDLPAWDPRGKRGNAMAYMTCNVGANHMRAGYRNPTGLPDAPAVDLMPELIRSQHENVIRDSLILCAFASGATPASVQLEAVNAITGLDRSWADLMSIADRQWTTARQWNVDHWDRIGRSPRLEDRLSFRLRSEPLPSGTAQGMRSFVDDSDEEACLDSYYALRGWGVDGRP